MPQAAAHRSAAGATSVTWRAREPRGGRGAAGRRHRQGARARHGRGPRRRRGCSTASSAPRTGWPGSRPTSRRCGSSPPMPSGCRRAARLGEIEELLVRIGIGEYLAQILGGIPMSQGEIVRLVRSRPVRRRGRRAHDADGRGADRDRQHRAQPRAAGRTDARAARRRRSATSGLDDTLESIRDEMRKFADSEVDRRTRRAGTAPTATSRSRSSRRWPSSACSA